MQAAQLFKVSLSTVKRYLLLEREGRLYELCGPYVQPTRRKISPDEEQLLLQLCEDHPDWSNEERRQHWENTYNTQMSESTMRRAVIRLGWTVKKKQSKRANETNSSEKNMPKRSKRNRSMI